MPARREPLRAPADYIVGGYLAGRVRKDAPVGVAAMRTFAANLANELAETATPVAELARVSGIDRSVIYDILAGRSWANAVTIARLEHTLAVALWRFE